MKIDTRKNNSHIEIKISIDDAQISATYYGDRDCQEARKLIFDALQDCFDGYCEFAEYLLEMPIGKQIKELVKQNSELLED